MIDVLFIFPYFENHQNTQRQFAILGDHSSVTNVACDFFDFRKTSPTNHPNTQRQFMILEEITQKLTSVICDFLLFPENHKQVANTHAKPVCTFWDIIKQILQTLLVIVL